MRPSSADPEPTSETPAMASGGVIRYRLWMARQHPIRFSFLAVLALALAAGVGFSDANIFWSFMALLALALTAAMFFFPSLVTLDGPTLIVRRLGLPQTHDLRHFESVRFVHDLMGKAELIPMDRPAPMNAFRSLTIPLPSQEAVAAKVQAHLNYWVGRRVTGQFEWDLDQIPEEQRD